MTTTKTPPRVDPRFTLLCIGVWLHSSDTLITATIAPALIDDLQGVAYINWTIAIYEIGAIITGAVAAMLCTRFGIKRVFLAAAAVYGGGCAIGGLAPTMGVLIGARLVQGMGGGMLLSLCYVAVEAWYDPKEWSRLFGIVAMIWGGGSLVGPLIGGLFSAPGLWRGSFWAFAAQAALLVALAQWLFPTARKPPADDVAVLNAPPPRWPLAALTLLSAATLLIAASGAASEVGHSPLRPIVGCLLGMALLYLAARTDRSAAVRLLPPQLLNALHPVGAGLLMVFMLSAATTGFWAYGPLLLKILFDTRPLVTGYILAAEAFAWAFATLAVSTATPAADSWLIRSGALGIATGAAGFAIVVPSGSLLGMVVCALLQGAGFGLCWPAIVQRIVRFSAPAEQSLASASASTVQRIGYAVGSAAVGISANASGLADGVTASAAKAASFWVFAAFVPLLMVGVWGAWVFTGPRSHRASPV